MTAPDHLALVAAAYRDAAEVAESPVHSGTGRSAAIHIRARTPADAEAHLTALLARAQAAEAEVARLREALAVERGLADAFAAGLRIGDRGGVIMHPGRLRKPIADHAALRKGGAA